MKWVVALLALASLSCSGSQQRPWTTTASAGVVAAAHAIDTVDAVVAQAYTDRADAGVALAELDSRVAPIIVARRVARSQLLIAQADIEAAARIHDGPSACTAAIAVHAVVENFATISEAVAVGGFTEPPLFTSALIELRALEAASPRGCL